MGRLSTKPCPHMDTLGKGRRYKQKKEAMKIRQEKMFDEPPEGATLFDRFWAAYPRKVSKGAARRAWEKLSPDKDMADNLIGAVISQKRWREREQKANRGEKLPDWKYPATWLNSECWSDEIPATNGYFEKSKAQAEPCNCGEPSVVYNGEGKWCAKCFVDRFTDYRKKINAVQQQIGMERKNGESASDYAKRCRMYCIEHGFNVAPPETESEIPGPVSVHGDIEEGGPGPELPPLSAYF